MRQYYRIANSNKKGSGLTDFFSILVFVLILLVFYLLLNFTIGHAKFQISTESSNIRDSISVLSVLRTPIVVDNKELNIGELIALSDLDQTKNELLEKKLTTLMDESFGTSSCAIMCINERKIKNNGCGLGIIYFCSDNAVIVPSYEANSIKVSLQTDAKPIEVPVT